MDTVYLLLTDSSLAASLKNTSFLTTLNHAQAAIGFDADRRIFVLKSCYPNHHGELFDLIGIDVERDSQEQGVDLVYYRLSSTPRNMAFLLKYGISRTNQLG